MFTKISMRKAKYIVFIILILATITAEGQTGIKLKKKYSKKIEEKEWRIPLLSTFKVDFPVDTATNRYGDLQLEKAYKRSATIFDATGIVLLPGYRFFCYYHGCLKEGVSGGSYTVINDTITLVSSKKVYKSLEENEFLKRMKYKFIELGSIRYLKKEDSLVFVE